MKYNAEYGKFLTALGKKTGKVAVCEAAHTAYKACCEAEVPAAQPENSLPMAQNGTIDLTRFNSNVLNWCMFLKAIGHHLDEVPVTDTSYDMETYIYSGITNPTDDWDKASALFWSKIPVVSTCHGGIVADITGTIERSIDNIINERLYRFRPERAKKYRNYSEKDLEIGEPLADNIERDADGNVTFLDNPNPKMMARLGNRYRKRLADAGMYDDADNYSRDDYVLEIMENMESILSGNVSAQWLEKFANALV